MSAESANFCTRAHRAFEALLRQPLLNRAFGQQFAAAKQIRAISGAQRMVWIMVVNMHTMRGSRERADFTHSPFLLRNRDWGLLSRTMNCGSRERASQKAQLTITARDHGVTAARECPRCQCSSTAATDRTVFCGGRRKGCGEPSVHQHHRFHREGESSPHGFAAQ